MADKIQVGNIGVVLRLTITEDGAAVPVNGASTKQIVLGKPDGTSVTKTAAYTTDGSDGKIQYTTTSTADLDVPGWWQVQGYVAISGFTGHSEVLKFFVHPNIG